MKLHAPIYDDHYTEEDDARKAELIALKADSVATAEDLIELGALQKRAAAWRERHSPLHKTLRTMKAAILPGHLKAFYHHCHPGVPFLIRLRLFALFGWHLNLHIFLRSDADPELHDHPWSFWSLVLAGGYYEHTETGTITRRAGSFAYRPATWRHRVQLALDDTLKPIPCATLVLTGPAKRDWGFWKNNTFTPWKTVIDRQGGDNRVEAIDEPARTLTGAHRGEKALVAPSLQKFHGDHEGRADGSRRNHSVQDPLLSQDTSNRFALTESTLAPVVTNTANSKTTGRGPNAWTAEEPMRTQTSGPQFANVEAKLAPFLTEHANASAQRTMAADEPLRTQCGEVKGGHFAMVAGTMVQTGYGERDGQAPRALDIEKPAGTAVAGGCKQAVVTSTIVNTSNGKFDDAPSRARSVEEGLPPVTGVQKFAAASATLVHTAHGEQDKNGKKRGRGARDITEPMPTLLASPDGAVASATLIGAGGPSYSGKPKPVDVPMNAQTTENHAAIAATSMVKLRGEVESHPHAGDITEPGHTISASGQHHGLVAAHAIRHFGESVGQSLDTAGPTVMPAGQGKTGMVASYLAQHNAGFNDTVGHPADAPISTISQKGSQQQVVAGSLAAYYGSEADGQGVDEPARTGTTKPRLAHTQSLLTYGMTEAQLAGARRVATFLREHGVQFEGEFATVRGGWVIVDIGMRMLTPRELYRAQGFPESYIIDKAWLVNPHTGAIIESKLTKEEQIRMCGNSVCPDVMRALVHANVPYLATWYKGEQRRPQRKTRRLLQQA